MSASHAELVAPNGGQSITVTGAPHHLMLVGHNPFASPRALSVTRIEDVGGTPLRVDRVVAGDVTIEGSGPLDLPPGPTDLVVWFSGDLPPGAETYRLRVHATIGQDPVTLEAEIHRARREPIR